MSESTHLHPPLPDVQRINTLRIKRKVLIAGIAIDTVATLTLLSYGAVDKLGHSVIFSGDWWSGILIGCIASAVLMFYLWGFVVAFDVAGVPVHLSPIFGEWLGLGFVFGTALPWVAACIFSVAEPEQPPVLLSLVSAVLFFLSIVLFATINETSILIREATDPTFKRAAGFT
ncbi:MAG: hypothetical protein ACRC46_07270 [Thermoguttaceae bacterium]